MQITDKGRVKQKRGTGEGVNWRPWHRRGEVGGLGRSPGIPSFKFPGRLIHTFSTIEERLIYLVEYSSIVSDFYEQYPLPLKQTKAIANELQIEHIPEKNREKVVMTTDLVVKLTNGKMIAFCVKNSIALKDPRVIAKIQIEKTYWDRLGIKWSIITEKEFDQIVSENLKILRGFIHLKNQYKNSLLSLLKEKFKRTDARVDKILESCAKDLNITSADAIGAFHELVATKRILFDITSLFSIQKNASEFSFT